LQTFQATCHAQLQRLIPPENDRPVRVFSQDESRFGLLTVRRRRLTARGVQPVGSIQHVFEGFYVYGAVAPTTGERFFVELPYLNPENFQLFIDLFAQAFPDSLNLLLLDNSGAHTAHQLTIPEIASVVGVPIPPMPADILEGFAVTTGSYPREVSAIAHEVNRAIGWDDPHDFSLSQPPGDYDRQIALAGSWLTETPADVTDPVVGFSAPAAGSPGKGGASDGSDIGIAYNAYFRKDWAKAVVTLPTQTRAAAGRSVSVPASKAHQYQVYAYVQVSSPHRGIERFKIEGVTVERDLATIISSPDGWVGKAPQRWIDLGTHANDGALNITWSQAKSAETFFLRQLPTVEEAYARIAGVADPVLPAGATAPPPPNTKRLAAPHPCHTPPVFNTTHVCTHEPLTGGARCYRGLSSCWSRSRPPRSRRRIVPPKRRAGRARPIRSAAALSWPTSPS
jgi:hypothetical protein